MPKPRAAAARARLAEHAKDLQPLAWWLQVIAEVCGSPLLRGDKGDWRATPDWCLSPTNLAKILEGNYRDRPPIKRDQRAARDIPLPDDALRPCELCGAPARGDTWKHRLCSACAGRLQAEAIKPAREAATDPLASLQPVAERWLSVQVHGANLAAGASA